METVSDVMSACLIGISINILDPDTYSLPVLESNISDEERDQFVQEDSNALSKIDRMTCTYVRGLSWSLLQWLDEKFYLQKNGRGINFIEMANNVLVDLCCYLWTFKTRAHEQYIEGATGCNLDSLKRQIDGLFDEDSQIPTRLKIELGKLEGKITDFNMSGYTVEPRNVPLPHKFDLSLESMHLGLNSSDKLYYKSIYGSIDTMMHKIKHVEGGEEYTYYLLNASLTIPTGKAEKGKKRKRS